MAINTEGARLRRMPAAPNETQKAQVSDDTSTVNQDEHPVGPVKHNTMKQVLRLALFVIYFFTSAFFIHGGQIVGSPLYFINRKYYYAWMGVTKQYFGLFLTTGTQWWSPTVIRVSGDVSVAGQLKQTADGLLECDFPDRLILLSNHQIYTDWVYIWWSAYTAGYHGYVYIILKQSLKWVPIVGPAMQFYSFIFMARKWASDQMRMRYRLEKLNKPVPGRSVLDPMWLLIFPEGTNLSANTRRQSAKWAEKNGIPDMKHLVLPRSLGLQFCLKEIGLTTEYVYDCTIAYDPVPEGGYAETIYTLSSVYGQGLPPKSVNMHWRRFKTSDIPYSDPEAMDKWLMQRWREKDELMETHRRTGRFPADASAVVVHGGAKSTGYIETEVRPSNNFEILQIYVPFTTAILIANIVYKLYKFALYGSMN